jgi:CubicO group peptidase (beta-lactamase class C family)
VLPVTGLHGVAMVTKGGTVKADLAGGMADAGVGVPCTSATRFQLCSVSKQFAAAAVMLLVESGRLDLNEPVARWLPEGHPQWGRVTLHQLLSHTAGVSHWQEAPNLDPSEPAEIGARLAAVLAAPLRTEPGWLYSSPAFLLVGLIVERASGQPYREFITDRILSPLKLTRTTMGPAPDGAARGYEDGEPVPAWDLTAMPGTGDIWSTTGDLTRFVTALHSGELLTASSLRAMCTAYTALNDDDAGEPRMTTTGYGYGMYTGTFAGHQALYHTGDNPGYLSFACWIPDLAASVVVLLNDASASVTGLVRQLLPAALEP